jgi:hypothetical protein
MKQGATIGVIDYDNGFGYIGATGLYVPTGARGTTTTSYFDTLRIYWHGGATIDAGSASLYGIAKV